MINWIRDGRLARIGAVIVDEAHERSENIDLILALLREQLPRYPRLRVIIASATIDKDFFVEYFGGHGRVHHLPVPSVKSFGYGIPFFPNLALDAAVLAEGMDDGLDGRFAGFDDTVLDGSGQTVHEHALHLAALRPTTAVDLREWIERPSPDAEKRTLEDAQERKIAAGRKYRDLERALGQFRPGVDAVLRDVAARGWAPERALRDPAVLCHRRAGRGLRCVLFYVGAGEQCVAGALLVPSEAS